MKYTYKTKYQSGQALLIVLLALAVTLTIVLSSVSRSITDISISTQEADSLRAFSAAEAGVEESLSSGLPVNTTALSNDAEFTTTVTTSQSGSTFLYPSNRVSGESATFWFLSHDDDGDITCSGEPCLAANSFRVCWGSPSNPVNSSSPAVEVSLFYDTSGQAVASDNYQNVRVTREAYDGVSTAVRGSVNNFSPASSGCTIDGNQYRYNSGNISFASLGIPCSGTPGCLMMARVRLLYNETIPEPVVFSTTPTNGTTFPSQGIQIESLGTAGEATRRVSVYQSYPEFPEIFEAGVFGLQDLTKSN